MSAGIRAADGRWAVGGRRDFTRSLLFATRHVAPLARRGYFYCVCHILKKTAAAFVSGGSNVITFVPVTNAFEKTDIDTQSIGIVPRLVEYTGEIVPVGV